MSPRLKRIRKVVNPPVIKGFKPYGPESKILNKEPINLLYEEYEALRLCDFDLMNHYQASIEMGVSRPTFTRIYASVRQKIAQAFVEGRQISIEGGKVYFDSDWFHCPTCNCFFNNPEKETQIEACPLCGNSHINEYDYDNTYEDEPHKKCDIFYVCPRCGFKQKHQHGISCKHEICPNCQTVMNKKGSSNCRKLKKSIL